ncbi:hypothetical protein ACFQO7_29275 [Catellatospora aurea]|uniref:Uncharacterized protein n=1 Tax=Catellatospora aurea TaxID=1337874 RepID=A0ABW2H7D8_9ACTN
MSEPRFTPPAEDFEPPPEREPLPEPAGGDLPAAEPDLPPEGMDDLGTAAGEGIEDRLERELPDVAGEPPD